MKRAMVSRIECWRDEQRGFWIVRVWKDGEDAGINQFAKRAGALALMAELLECNQ